MKLNLKNVGVIDSCEVEFVPGINIIVGSSGSGKSTLLRSIHNIAVNEFSDSDISFGKESMTISVECDNNIIEYSRFTKSKGDKFYYVVNGEKYSKVGRQPLQVVSDILKLGDININGDCINFNFNMQFSTPFLIFGSQSTLYNVLTYRSQFDISKINDCYNADIKANNSEINTTIKVRDQLNESLESLLNQEKKLKPVEELYSSYTTYRHLESNLSDIDGLLNNLQSISSLSCRVNSISSVLAKIEKSLSKLEFLIAIHNYKLSISTIERLNEFIHKTNALDNDYRCAESLSIVINDVSWLNTVMKQCIKEMSDIEALQSNIDVAESFLKQSSFIAAAVECGNKITLYDKLCKSADILSMVNRANTDIVSDAISVLCFMTHLQAVESELTELDDKIHSVSTNLSSFKICPLCGSYLHSENSHEGT